MEDKNYSTLRMGGYMRVGVIVALIGVLIAIIVGVYFLGDFNKYAQKENTKINDKTADSSVALTTNWKTYRNEQFGFEVKYPDTMTYSDEDLKIGEFTIIANQINFIKNGTMFDLTDQTNLFFTIDIADESRIKLLKSKYQLSKIEVINGNEFIFYKITDTKNPHTQMAYTLKDSKVYIIWLSKYNYGYGFDKFISTFKFIK